MIVADTSALLALIDADDHHHEAVRSLFEEDPALWVLPWAILPEVDYLLLRHLGLEAELAFLGDVAEGRFEVVWGDERDVARSRYLARRHRDLAVGLVDGVVMAVAERLRARAIATLDRRHFGAVKLQGTPLLLP